MPEYLIIAAEQARLFNPECQIYLVASREALDTKKFRKRAKKIRLILIPYEDLPLTPEHRLFIQKSQHDIYFRGGFWRYATERFFYLYDFIAAQNLHDVFHLEYDNMLYADLTELLPMFQRSYPGMATLFMNDSFCVPGFVYVHTQEALKNLVAFLAEKSHLAIDDGQALALYHASYGHSALSPLPLIMKSYGKTYPLLCNTRGPKSKNPEFFHAHIEAFKSIFDAAAIGQYLGGIDPRNSSNWHPGFINTDCVFNVSHWKFIWKLDSLGRKVPYAQFGPETVRINNLHIHSKMLEKFVS